MMRSDPAGAAFSAAALLSVVVAVIAWRRRASRPTTARAMAALMVGTCLWSVASAVRALAPDPFASARLLVIFPAVGLAVVAFMCMAISVAQPQWRPSRRLLRLLTIQPAIMTVAGLTNPWHRWVYTGPGTAELSGAEHWEPAALFWAHTAYSYTLLGIGFVVLLRGWWTAPPVFRAQRRTVLLGSLLPVVINAVLLAGGLEEIPEPTPIGFAIASVLFMYGIFRQGIVAFTPVARGVIVEQMSDAIVVVSPGGHILDVNEAASALVLGAHPEAGTRLVGQHARAVLGPDLADMVDEEREVTVDVHGSSRELHVRASRLVDDHGRFLGRVLVARDVTHANAQARQLERANERLVRQVQTIERLRADLAEQASRDALTGLHNRRYATDRLAELVAAGERDGSAFGVVLLDVDRFKVVNDTYGHTVGDAVLVAVAGRLAAAAPAGAVVARWGGEEFLVAIPGADVAAAERVAESLRVRCARDPVSVPGNVPVAVTVSAGAAAFPGSGVGADALVRGADDALYAAKRAGRNAVRALSPDAAHATVD